MDLVMTQEEEEKFSIHIQEWLQQIIAMVEILQDANEMENHSQMLGMRQKIGTFRSPEVETGYV